MRSFTILLSGFALSAFAAGAMAQNVPTNNPDTQPATAAASKPAGQLGNSGGGLSMGMTPRQASMAFDHLDANHDGFVSREEFMHYGDSGQRFPGCDTNHDGKLSRAEYIACSQRPAQQHSMNGNDSMMNRDHSMMHGNGSMQGSPMSGSSGG